MTRGHYLGTISLAAAASLLALTASCTGKDKPDGKAGWRQGWSSEQRLAWYQGGQGSRLMPFSWAKALEQKDNEQPFLAPEHMASFRFLALPESRDGLPVGFARDRQNDDNLSFTKLRWFAGQGNQEDWLGLNCSACHTAEISYKGVAERIDGGPSLVDFQSFNEAVDDALNATLTNDSKFERFATKVLPKPKDAAEAKSNRDMLKSALAELVAWEKENARLNNTLQSGDPLIRYGYGRLDAFGHIFNKVSQLAVYEKGKPPLARATPNPSDAPVSYPFLWDIYRQNKLQWNGIVDTKRIKLGAGFLDYGALGRNAGEVIGVFGDVVLEPESSHTVGFRSSIQADNLNRLESVLRSLEPPKWPDRFGVPDKALVDAGRTLFEKKGCKGCHTIEPAGDSVFEVHMTPLTRDSAGTPNRNNTDPWMACNAISYRSASGKLEGRPLNYFRGTELKSTDQLSNLLTTSVVGSLVAKWNQLLGTAADIFFGVDPLPKVVGGRDKPTDAERRALRLGQCYSANSPLFAYKARPLDGIWATPPYLHNGSVPTLYDLLTPPDQRPASFNVGTREYDPAKVGYVTSADAAGNSFTFTARGNGNSNEGHDYNVGKLTPQERSALLEYLKTL